MPNVSSLPQRSGDPDWKRFDNLVAGGRGRGRPVLAARRRPRDRCIWRRAGVPAVHACTVVARMRAVTRSRTPWRCETGSEEVARMGTRIVGTAGILVWCALGAGVAAQAPPPAESRYRNSRHRGRRYDGAVVRSRLRGEGRSDSHTGRRPDLHGTQRQSAESDRSGRQPVATGRQYRAHGRPGLDPNGDLVGTAINGRKVVRFTPTRTVLADNYQGQPFSRPTISSPIATAGSTSRIEP